MNKMYLLPHQENAKKEIVSILNKKKLCYLAGATRSGKTLTVLFSAEDYGAKKVIFITSKKAIHSIENDYKKGEFTFKLTVINYESVHKITDIDFDFLICDEAHNIKSFPKPSVRAKIIKERFSHLPCVLMSGTPFIESYSECFHQFWISEFSPFREFKNFYRWADVFVDKQQKRIGTHIINDYSNAKENEIKKIIDPITVIMKKPPEAFTEPKEHFLYIDMPDKIKRLVIKLNKDRAIIGQQGYIMADSIVKLQSKIHQIENGTVIIELDDETTKPVVLSDYKAKYIYQKFRDKKIVIFVYYQAEKDLIKQVYKEEITEDLQEFKETDKSLLIQQSTTEGLNLSEADCLVYYNFGFSGKNYLQSRDRLTISGRKINDIYFVFPKGGMNEKIYHSVSKKKNYNSLAFSKDYGIKKTNRAKKQVEK